MSHRPSPEVPAFPRFSRRTLTSVGAALGAAALLGSSARAQSGTPQATPAVTADGEWSFTDDKGVTVTLPQRPTRIFMDLSAAAPMWDFGIKPIGVCGWTVGTDASWGNVDRSTPDISLNPAESGMPDTEKLLTLAPDLYINITWDPADPLSYWGYPDQESIDLVQGIVPMIAISATGLADVNMGRFAELAVSLGADLNSPDLVAAKTAYDESLAAFEAAAAEKADLQSMFFSVIEPEMYVASPQDWADLNMYTTHGLNILQPDAEPGAYWETISTELAGKYPTDIVFVSTRSEGMQPDAMKEHPTIGLHPAIKAGQVYPWNQDFIMSYQGLTSALDGITQALQASKKLG